MATSSDNPKQGTYHIAFCPVTGVDAIAFRLRRDGWEVRDCFCIHRVEGPVMTLLVRRPLDATVHESIVREGVGALDIDGCRIQYISEEDKTPTVGKGSFEKEKGVGASFPHHKEGWGGTWKCSDTGRFPANLLLVHGPDCEQRGTKKVKNPSGSVTGGEPSSVTTREIYASGHKRMSFAAYASEDGTEEVADWNCQSDCPVHLLDMQSGTLTSGHLSPEHDVKATTGWSGGSQADRVKQVFESNSGGASRFFYQGQKSEDIEDYLDTLIRRK